MLPPRRLMVFAVGYHTCLRDLTFGSGLAIKFKRANTVLMVSKAYQIIYIRDMGTCAQTIRMVAPNRMTLFDADSLGHRILGLA